MQVFNMGEDIHDQIARYRQVVHPRSVERRAVERQMESDRLSRIAISMPASSTPDDKVTREALRLGYSSEVAQRVSTELRKFNGDPDKAIKSGWVQSAALMISREIRKQRGLP